MLFDSFNLFLVGLALVLLAVAVYRADAFAALRKPKPRGPLGFQP